MMAQLLLLSLYLLLLVTFQRSKAAVRLSCPFVYMGLHTKDIKAIARIANARFQFWLPQIFEGESTQASFDSRQTFSNQSAYWKRARSAQDCASSSPGPNPWRLTCTNHLAGFLVGCAQL